MFQTHAQDDKFVSAIAKLAQAHADLAKAVGSLAETAAELFVLIKEDME